MGWGLSRPPRIALCLARSACAARVRGYAIQDAATLRGMNRGHNPSSNVRIESSMKASAAPDPRVRGVPGTGGRDAVHRSGDAAGGFGADAGLIDAARLPSSAVTS